VRALSNFECWLIVWLAITGLCFVVIPAVYVLIKIIKGV
jgi:hypothetical protein